MSFIQGENFDVICPRFHFKCPEISLSSSDVDDEQYGSEEDIDDEDDEYWDDDHWDDEY